MKDKISIITTFYNSEDYILQAINSVNSQIISDDFDVEYILVNDQSTDKTLDIIKYFFSKIKNDKIEVRIINTPNNLGVGSARKLGIKESTGNYLMFLDSDDYYLNNNFLLKAYYNITKNNADVVDFGYLLRHPQNFNVIQIVSQKDYILENNKLVNMRFLFIENKINFMIWTKIIKKSLINLNEYSDSRTFDDIESVPKIIYNANKIVVINSVEVNYRCKQNSIFNSDEYVVRYESTKASSKLFEYFKDNVDILKMIYDRCFIDLETILSLNSNSEYFRKMSKLNTYMLSYIYPNDYKDITYDVENDNNK